MRLSLSPFALLPLLLAVGQNAAAESAVVIVQGLGGDDTYRRLFTEQVETLAMRTEARQLAATAEPLRL